MLGAGIKELSILTNLSLDFRYLIKIISSSLRDHLGKFMQHFEVAFCGYIFAFLFLLCSAAQKVESAFFTQNF